MLLLLLIYVVIAVKPCCYCC